MLFKNEIPNGFKILSDRRILVIQYCEKLSLYPIKRFLIILVMFLTIPIFIICCWFFAKSLVDAGIPDKILQPAFWQAIQNFSSHERNDFLLLIGFPYFMGIMFSGFTIYELVWSLWGISEFRASPEKLIVSHQLWGISRTHLILRDSLLYFQEYQILKHKQNNPTWTLKAITNQRRFFLFHFQVVLLQGKSIQQSDWLGTRLANFYQVKFLPSKRSL